MRCSSACGHRELGEFMKKQPHLIVHRGFRPGSLWCNLEYSGSTLVDMPPDVGALLSKLSYGDESAFNELVAALYDELHLIAARHLRAERPEHTLQTTALVREAYVKLLRDHERGFADRVHFLSVASRVMRQVLVDYAGARATKKTLGRCASEPETGGMHGVHWSGNTSRCRPDPAAGSGCCSRRWRSGRRVPSPANRAAVFRRDDGRRDRGSHRAISPRCAAQLTSRPSVAAPKTQPLVPHGNNASTRGMPKPTTAVKAGV